MKLKAKLENGIKLKGNILIYPDHLFIDNERVELSQILEVKLATRTIRNAVGGSIAGTIINQIRDNGSTALLLIESAHGAIMSIFLLDKRYKRDKGWSYSIESIDRLNTFRRF